MEAHRLNVMEPYRRDVIPKIDGRGRGALPAHPGKLDKDFMCPICMDPMKDAFLTSCGHSFCYTCITTHLQNRSNCPCCSQYLTKDQIFPNFALDKVLKKATSSHHAMSSSATQQLRLALEQGQELTVKELDALMEMLAEKRRRAEQEEAEMNMEILVDFLERARDKKQAELDELQTDLQLIRGDIAAVEARRQQLQHLREKAEAMAARAAAGNDQPPAVDPREWGLAGKAVALAGMRARLKIQPHVLGPKRGRETLEGHQLEAKEPAQRGPDVVEGGVQVGGRDGSADAALAAATVAKKRRVFAHFQDLQQCYLQQRRHSKAEQGVKSEAAAPSSSHSQKQSHQPQQQPPPTQGLPPLARVTGLEGFQRVLSDFTKFSRLKVVAELRHGDLFHSSNIVSSIEFDRDDEFFATAGVSRRIKVFEYAAVASQQSDVHCPVVEMSTRSKLSCLSWNKYLKTQIASSDYEGIVAVWDVATAQSVVEFEEHEKRAWSVDFSLTEPTRLVSGSDDGKVKLWCTRQEGSLLNIDMKANICCVKFNPGSSNYIAVGSADHHIHYFDIRNATLPLHVFSGHRKAVSYVKFLSSNELASASTDSTLRLWDVQSLSEVRTLSGHTNEKNFVGLSVGPDYIACGSETNEVYVYYKAMSKAMAVHRFTSTDPFTGDDSDDDAAHFISAVSWKADNKGAPTMLAANSQGIIKVLGLTP